MRRSLQEEEEEHLLGVAAEGAEEWGEGGECCEEEEPVGAHLAVPTHQGHIAGVARPGWSLH